MEGAAGDTSPGLPRPLGLEDMFTDEGWDSLSEDRRCLIIEAWNGKVEYTEESRRVHEELVVGKGSTNFPPNPCLLPDDYEGPAESVNQPWRIFTDPDAVSQLLNLANEHHWQMEREEREAMLQRRHLADAAAKRDGGSTGGKQGKPNSIANKSETKS